MAKRQIPTPLNEWLYKQESENERLFAHEIYLPDGEPEWAECTNEEKEAWEEEHKPIEPETPENPENK